MNAEEREEAIAELTEIFSSVSIEDLAEAMRNFDPRLAAEFFLNISEALSNYAESSRA